MRLVDTHCHLDVKKLYHKKIRENRDLTVFQKKVLLAVLDIPKGEVRSYAGIAKSAGSPAACRAVGRALACNTYAPHVPCHRVITSRGTIGGYSKGLSAKRRLLLGEGVIL